MASSRRAHLAAVAALTGLLVVAGSCRTGAPTLKHPERLVLVSYDGLGAELATRWIAEGIATQPFGLGGLFKHGFVAERTRCVDPTVTSVNHASLISGRMPATTGIVGNLFHLPHTPLTATASGYESLLAAPTLWQHAHAQGKRVGIITWPCGIADRRAYPDSDFGVLWPTRPHVSAAVLELDPEQAEPFLDLPSHDGIAGLLWRSVEQTSLTRPQELRLDIAVFDAVPDNRARYDTVACRLTGQPEWTLLQDRGWFSLQLTLQATPDEAPFSSGAWCKVLHLDRHRGDLRLYRGAMYRFSAYPLELAQRLETEVGYWPGPPDGQQVAAWWLDATQGIDLETYLEQLDRFDHYLDRLAQHLIATEPFNLLLAYHPSPDDYQHSSLLVNERQWAWSPGRALAAREGLKEVGSVIDRSISDLWQSLHPQRDALVVVSDHGLVPVHDVVYLNQALAEHGLVQVDDSGAIPRVAPTSPMRVISSGGSAHLYLNLQGREPGGVVTLNNREALLLKAARVLADISVEAEPVVEQVLTRSEAAGLGLDSERTGDLVVFLYPGYVASDLFSSQVVAPSRVYGHHGFLNHYDALCGVFAGRGAGIKSKHVEELRITAVAAYIAHWLGIDLTDTAPATSAR